MKLIDKLKTYITHKKLLILFFITQGFFLLGFIGISPFNIILSVPLFIISICCLSTRIKCLFLIDVLLLIFLNIFTHACFLISILIGLGHFLIQILLLFYIVDLLIVSKKLYSLFKYKYDHKLFKNKVFFVGDILLFILSYILMPICLWTCILSGFDNFFIPMLLLFCIIGVIIAVIKLYLLYKSKYYKDFT